jgi:hypothetical protein
LPWGLSQFLFTFLTVGSVGLRRRCRSSALVEFLLIDGGRSTIPKT